MRKISYVLLSLLFVTSFVSCSKDRDSENISKTTFYVDLKLKGNDVEVIRLNEDYKDKGVTALENQKDISKDVTVDGKVDNSAVGLYTIKYTSKNKDGYEKSIERTVVVAPETKSSVDISGIYKGGREGKSLLDNACEIKKVGDGVFMATDFFGGYYEQTRKYGSAYALKTVFYLDADNTYKMIGAINKPFGGGWMLQNAKYDDSAKTLKHRVYQGAFGFNVTLTKN